MPMRGLFPVILFLTLSFCSQQAAGESGILRDVFGTGGAEISGSGYRIHGTVGQTGIGLMGGPTLHHRAGFWYGIEGPAADVAEPDLSIPGTYSLAQNSPNPFNPRTTIAFGVPKTGQVTLKIYDIAGREAASLVDAELAPGFYATVFHAHRLESGLYFYRLTAGDFSKTRKMLLLK